MNLDWKYDAKTIEDMRRVHEELDKLHEQHRRNQEAARERILERLRQERLENDLVDDLKGEP